MADTTSGSVARRGKTHRSPARGETRIHRLGKALRQVVGTQARSSLDRGLGYVRSEPVKALALIGAAGAIAGLLIRRPK